MRLFLSIPQRNYFFVISNAEINFLIFFLEKFVINKICITFALAIANHVPWCNGNTAVFGTVVQGSSPCGTTKKPRYFRGFFYAYSFLLDFKGNNCSFSMVY